MIDSFTKKFKAALVGPKLGHWTEIATQESAAPSAILFLETVKEKVARTVSAQQKRQLHKQP